MSDYKELAKIVLKEHEQVLMAVDDAEVEQLLDAIAKAKCIQVFGMGRMKCAVRARTCPAGLYGPGGEAGSSNSR